MGTCSYSVRSFSCSQVKLIQEAWVLAVLPDGGGGRILAPLSTLSASAQRQPSGRQDSDACIINTRSSSYLPQYGADGGGGGMHSSGGGGVARGDGPTLLIGDSSGGSSSRATGRDGPTLLIGDGGGTPVSGSRATSPTPRRGNSSVLAAAGAGLTSLAPPDSGARPTEGYPFASSAPTTREVATADAPRSFAEDAAALSKQQPRRQAGSSDFPSTGGGGGTAPSSSPPPPPVLPRQSSASSRPPPPRHDFTHLEAPAQRRMAGLLRMHVADSVRAHIEAGHLDFINE